MSPTKRHRIANRRYTYGDEVSPSKDGDIAKRSSSRKRKLSNMLGPRWNTEEITRFYDAYHKYGKDWTKVAGAVRKRSPEMVEALYAMNRAYMSLPHGTASAAGLGAMMTDHYSNLAGSDSDQESNDGAGSSRKTQKRARVNVQPTTSRVSDEQFFSNFQDDAPNCSFSAFSKKKRSGGSKPRPVGKRTPRFPFSYENIKGEKYFSPTRRGLKLEANANDDEVAHELAIALAEASQRGLVSRTPSKRAESATSSPFMHAQIEHPVLEMANAKHMAADMDEEDLAGSMEADTGELSRYRSYKKEYVSVVMAKQNGRKFGKMKSKVDDDNESLLDDINEECIATKEVQRLSAAGGKFDEDVMDAEVCRFSLLQRMKSKKVLSGRDEDVAFDALQTLADLSLMMPTENEDEILPANQKKGNRRSSGVRKKGYPPISDLDVASSKTVKSGKSQVSYASSAPEENQDPHQVITKTSRRKQKVKAFKETEAHLSQFPRIEAGDAVKKLVTKSKKTSQTSSPKLVKVSENSSSVELQKQGSDPAQSAVQIPVVSQVKSPSKVRSRRKMNLKKPEVQKDLKFLDKISDDQNTLPFASFPDRAFNFKEKLSNCLLNKRLRRWCTYEWFYSAIDYHWFAKREFVEYLYHVGLGHVPRLTRVEWSVIRSSLGKPRRFSEQFLMEEKEKLNQYRDSVRKHYTELREGVLDGLPTDLARPLSVGQRVIAIHPKTREIHDGSVLTVDHSRCRIQFDRHELGFEFVMDIDCMPLNPFDNIPALLGSRTVAVGKFSESFNELKVNGLAKEHVKLSSGDNLNNIDGVLQLSPLANPTHLLKHTKVVSANAQTRIESVDTAPYQLGAFSQSSALAQIQAKEVDVQVLAELAHALDKKEGIVLEWRRMNDDVFEDQKDGDGTLKDSDSEPFKKQYEWVLQKLSEANEQVFSALDSLRNRNTYQGNYPLTWTRPVTRAEHSGAPNSINRSHEPGLHVNKIIDGSSSKARTIVDSAMQAVSSMKGSKDTIEKIEDAVDYVNDWLHSQNSSMPVAPNSKLMTASDIKAQIPSELITKCVATLLMIQKCTERQFPPSDVAQIFDSAVTSLQPRSSESIPVYTEIQKCMGIIRNQIMALIPT